MRSTVRFAPALARQTAAGLPAALLLLTSGCTHDWKYESANDAGDGGRDAATSDATVGNDASERDATSSDDAALGCTETTCGRGSCNAQGGCDCESGYSFDGTRCQPGSCTATGQQPVCGANEVCSEVEGSAACDCVADHTRCSGSCVDPRTDPMNCGACGSACATGVSCEAGACVQKVHDLVLVQNTSCALMASADGKHTIRCWGQGRNDLYRDMTAKSATPRAIVGVASARGLGMGESHRCVIDANADKLQCWGRCGANCGLSAIGDVDSDLRDFAAPGVTKVSATNGFGGGNTCYINTSGNPLCLGYAASITDTIDRPNGTFLNVGAADQSAKFVNISGPAAHSCGATQDGRVACWGYNNLGQLGVPGAPSGGVAGYVKFDAPLTGDLMQARTVEANTAVSCAIVAPGDVYCWGTSASTLGFLGNGSTASHPAAVKVSGLPSDVVEIAVGGAMVLARTQSNKVYGWGSIPSLALGPNVTGDVSNGNAFGSAVEIPALQGAVEIAAGSAHGCARMNDGSVVCWGDNTDGQVGDGSEILRLVPVAVQGL